MAKKTVKKAKEVEIIEVEKKKPVKSVSEPQKAGSVECTQPFYDIEAKKTRQLGETWEVDKARADKLKSLGLVQVL